MDYIKISEDYIRTVDRNRIIVCKCNSRWEGFWQLHIHGVSCPGCGQTIRYKELLKEREEKREE